VAEATVTDAPYGAIADGVTDCTAAFQAAIDAVYNQGHRAGGVVYVPAGTYAFYGNLNVPVGVTLHGDWKDWTVGSGGAVGTILKVYTTGTADGTPFIDMYHWNKTGSNALIGFTIWYPNQLASSITPYPWTIKAGSASVVQNVVLVNSYQGIYAAVSANHTIGTVIGSPLSVGIKVNGCADISLMQDVRFSPDVWSKSGFTGAPALNGPQAAWMLANGTALLMGRVDGEFIIGGAISGYKIGMNMAWIRNAVAPEDTTRQNGGPVLSVYGLSITNCGTALVDSFGSGNTGNQFTNCTFSGSVGIDASGADNYGFDPSNPTQTTGGIAEFHNCTITGTGGTSIIGGQAWWMGLVRCSITGTIQQNYNVLNVVSSTLNAPTQCVLSSSSVLRGAFTGCTFLPLQNITNSTGTSSKLIVDPRGPSAAPVPSLSWSTVVTDRYSRKPAKNTLFVATTGYGAMGDGSHDDTLNIQNALNAASTNGGGIVYLPGGHYKTTGSLTVPAGVELRGVYETRHVGLVGNNGTTADTYCKTSVIQPTAGAGTTSGPPAIILQAGAGVRGVDINYETQSNTAPVAFPPAIQGRGANVYAIAVTSPNPYIFADLKTYACPNHFFYDACGWTLNTGFLIGNGSSGSIISSQLNPAYWLFLGDTANHYNSLVRAAVVPNMVFFDLAHCTETLLNDFIIPAHTMIRTTSEAGAGPTVTGISVTCDSTHLAFDLQSSDPSASINIVNPTMALVNTDGSTNDLAIIRSGAGSAGYFRLFNGATWGVPRYSDYVLAGSPDVGVEMIFGSRYSGAGGAQVGDSATFHLIGSYFYIDHLTDTAFTPYTLNFTGASGRISEIIGNVTRAGYTYTNANTSTLVNLWSDINLGNYTILNDLEYVQDDFSTNANFWTPYGGNWTVGGGQYSVNQGAGLKTVYQSSYGLGDVSCEADVAISASGGANSGLIFRVANPTIGTDSYQGYYAAITGNGRVLLGKANNNWTQLAVVLTPVSLNTLHRLKAVAQGSNIKVYLDDMTTPKIDYNDADFTAGAVGFRAHQTPTIYDNFFAGSLVYADRFDDGVADGWTTYGGTWAVSGGAYTASGGGGPKALANTFTSGDFTYDADVTFNGGQAGLIFRVNNPGAGTDVYQGYYAGLTAAGVIVGKANNGWTGLGSLVTPLTSGTVYHMRVVARGPSIKVYVNDMVTPKVSVTDSSYSSGAIGFRCLSSTATFDNATVVE